MWLGLINFLDLSLTLNSYRMYTSLDLELGISVLDNLVKVNPSENYS